MGKRNLKNLESYRLYRWRFYWGGAALAAVIASILLIGLDSSPEGLNQEELIHLGTVDSFRNVINEPINPITRIIQTGFLKMFGLTELGLRLGTAVVAALGCIAFFVALRNLYWTRLAMAGTFLLATSSWFLHQARIGFDSISYVLVLSVVVYTAHKAFQSKKGIWKIVAGLSIAVSLYTPLMLYTLIAVAIGLSPEIKYVLIKTKVRNIALAALAGVVALLPLLRAIWNDLSVAKTLLNIPADIPSVREYFVNIGDTFSFIFWRSFEAPGFHFDQLPMLDVFTVAMVALGLFQFERAWPSPRTRALFAAIMALLLTVSLRVTDGTMVVFMPFVYIVAAVGVSTLLSQWQEIFPKNPIARTLGVVPVAIVLMLTSYYHYNRYFVAWQSSSITEAAFDRRPTLLQKSLDALSFESSQVLLITGPEEEVTFQYLQTRYPYNVRVLADNSPELTAELNNNPRFAYIISGSNSFKKVQAQFGDPVESQASSIQGAGSLFHRFGQ